MSDYHRYYDKLYSGKNYAAECQTVLNIYKKVFGRWPNRLIDIGCGTGCHALEFSKHGLSVVGIDIDCGLISLAQEKVKDLTVKPRPKFFCQDISRLTQSNFDCALALFNVINYISKQDYLLEFFQAINKRLKKRGLFIFDCWNGVAAMTDKPGKKKSKLIIGVEEISVTTEPEQIDLFQQQIKIKNVVSVKKPNYRLKRFVFRYNSTLWTPWHLRNLLEMTGFRVRSISQWLKPQLPATEKTWKIIFICQKTS